MNPLLTPQFVPLDGIKVKELIDRYQAGDSEAALTILQSVGPLIMKIVKKTRVPRNVEFDDIYSELTEAILSSILSSDGGYDRSKSEPATYISMICKKRLPQIIDHLAGNKSYVTGDPADPIRKVSVQQWPIEWSDDNDTPDREHVEISSDNIEVLALAVDILQTHFTDPLDRQIFTDHLNDFTVDSITKRANTFISSEQDDSEGKPTRKKVDEQKVRKMIRDITAKLQAEMQQRGVLDPSGGALQRLMY